MIKLKLTLKKTVTHMFEKKDRREGVSDKCCIPACFQVMICGRWSSEENSPL